MPVTAPVLARSIVALVWAIGLSLSCATAASDTIGFEGRRYHKAYEDLQNPADHIAEFVLPGETIRTWTTLITFHAFPQSPPDAVRAATALGREVKARDGEFNLVANPATSEALVDFIIPAADGTAEFNVFKYAPVGNTSLIAAQYARRFRAGSLTPEQIMGLRARALAEMRRFDMAAVKTYFAQVR